MVHNKSKITTIFSTALLFFLLASATAVSAGTKVPEFSFSSVTDNKTIDIKDYRGKVVLINFWATWCGPCVKEIPSLIELQKQFGPQGFSVIGISVDQGSTSGVRKAVTKMGVNYPIVIGNSKVSRQFGGVFGVPTSFLVDRAGNVLKKYPGYVSHQIFVEDIKNVIK